MTARSCPSRTARIRNLEIAVPESRPCKAMHFRASLPGQDEDTSFERITVVPEIMDGTPTIRGLRIPVATVVSMIADGMTAAEVCADLSSGGSPAVASTSWPVSCWRTLP